MFLNKITAEQFHSMMERILEQLENDDYCSWKFINRLSEDGWIPPLAFDCYDYFQCPSSELSGKEIELGFIDFFEDNYESVFIKIINLEEGQNPFIHKMLLEVVQAYRQGLYQICIPSLFAILERYLADLSNDGDLNNVRYGMGLARKVWVKNDKDEMFIETDGELPYKFVQSCYLIKKFVDKYFMKIDFESFNSLNRHAFAHGRQQYYATKVDAVKLIFIITNIISMYYEIDFISSE
ncbi:hypothetical protein MUU49_20830 [Scandinavium goeteborgense]|uniref:hypothetical protein n=1 Tax=Scandinavium goeteborgense TaxID=1851514 RepID=UPI0021657C99|nr:hypothetical protein [Scandinavium goeteborgense]MCS2154998.1 hypothetical protein [Scandinavium goeteborgense]